MTRLTRSAWLWILLLAGCTSAGVYSLDSETLFGKTVYVERRADFDSASANHYRDEVEPILEQRCVVCHACYDAPCQLKLTSPEGIMRGANPEKVYQGTRLTAAEPTRLGIDAHSTAEWRDKGFHPVINERSQTPEANLQNSLIHKMLALKSRAPEETGALLSDDYNLSLNREQTCATAEEFNDFAAEHPRWGMPYGLPAISDSEYATLTEWLKDGAAMSEPRALPDHLTEQVNEWESYLNADDKKQQLASRYMYEHLFLANIYFSDEALFHDNQPAQRPEFFFKLVRSYTAPGLPGKIVPTRRPYDDPGTNRIYYRLVPVVESIVAKTHMPYRFNNERLAWVKSLFNEPEYEVGELPGYEPKVAANPFVAFHDLPVKSRYRFMLEESEYIIRGFIKGPVCRGQVALNVIDDHFWAVFTDPDDMEEDKLADFLSEQSNNLRLPGEAESNSGILTNWLRYSKLHGQYLEAKNKGMQERFPDGKELTLDLIWDGDGHNPNAALTIIRHFDSSSVVKGFVGQPPKTAWVVNYPLLERIHYLLVTEFDVFGNVGHQLMTRLYMDFLRMEGEHNFLTLLPQKDRVKLANYWYRDASDEVQKYLVNYEDNVITDPGIDYETSEPKIELFSLLKNHLKGALSVNYEMAAHATPEKLISLLPLNNVTGRPATLMPEISYLILDNPPRQPEVYTLLRASGHSNLTGLLYEEDNRLPEEDYLTVVPGILGTYPSAIYRLSDFRLKDFIKTVETLETEADYKALGDRYMVRRTDKQFWPVSDELHRWYRSTDVLMYGLLDYNRLENR
ncbi:MAG: fatty acid cis/trans isomerase [Thalassolituus sp.]